MQRQGGRGNLNAGDSGAARCQPQWQPLGRGRVQGPASSPAPRTLPHVRPDREKNPKPHWPARAYESSRKPGPGQLAGLSKFQCRTQHRGNLNTGYPGLRCPVRSQDSEPELAACPGDGECAKLCKLPV
jgi:hypothetical protein